MACDGLSSLSASFENNHDNGIDDTGAPLDLSAVFSHPAGLRTARHLVASLIQAAQTQTQMQMQTQTHTQNPGQQGNSHVSSTHTGSSPLSDSSPEVAGLLRDILAFSEAGNMESGSEDTGVASSRTCNQDVLMEEEAASTLIAVRSQRSITNSSFASRSPLTNAHNSNAPNSIYSSTAGQSSMQRTQHQRPPFHGLPSALDTTSAFRASESPLHGTESPYNVESPSGRSSAPSMSRQSSGRPANGSKLPNPESEPLRLDRSQSLTFPSHFPSSQNPAKIQARSYGVQSSHQRIQPHNPASAGPQNRMGSNTSSNIKAFLPVNKASDKGTVARKESSPADRTTSVDSRNARGGSPRGPLISSAPQRTPTLISPHPGADHPTANIAGNLVWDVGTAKKRRAKALGAPREKRQKKDIADTSKIKGKRVKKDEKPTPAAHKISNDLWLRIIEFSPPSFLKKVRLLNKDFKAMVDTYDSIYVNQRMENFGSDIPTAVSMGLSERQYTNLLGGKGCMEPGCDDKKASRTHWSWAQRWCTDCWRNKIEREDRILKARQHDFPNRQVLTKLLECIPIGMHDSFMKAHDYIEDMESRPASAPRIYKYYLKAEVDKVIEEYQAFKPAPFKDDPAKSAAENASDRTEHQAKEAAAVVAQTKFLDDGKVANSEHMQRVLKIEAAIRAKRQGDAQPYNENRKARRELFLKRAATEIPDIPESFIVEAKAFKAATRIFRDPGTERGWQTLKPKIQKEWDDGAEARQAKQDAEDAAEAEGSGDDEMNLIDQSQDELSRMDGRRAENALAQNQPHDQLRALGHQQLRQGQFDFSQYLTNSRTTYAGGMLGNYSNNRSSSSMISGSGGAGLSNYHDSSLFYNTQQFHSQPASQLHHIHSNFPQMSSLPQMSLGFNPYQNQHAPQHISHNYYTSTPQPPQAGKIPVHSLLAEAPAPINQHFSGYL
ncbi:hypothetical protein PZA11_001016 [Diplocarpon coronariae]|uniref:F-box domain-containing protein n=1 Tax=Diplocarpon coronariae TaxID=2795749 RepID=A0A218ZH07_9HELO|nr:hypothetical protein JHW43_002348 [Diplocarpon mali]OWP07361.1 hypothetical protein B2J93_6140 [Marssonina coronariae]